MAVVAAVDNPPPLPPSPLPEDDPVLRAGEVDVELRPPPVVAAVVGVSSTTSGVWVMTTVTGVFGSPGELGAVVTTDVMT